MSTLHSIIPADRVSAVELALQQAFNTQDVTAIVPLAGGLSASSVYRIAVNGNAYVLKMDAPASNGQAKQAAQTSEQAPGQALRVSHLQLAADAGVAPPLYHQDIVTGISISGLIDSKPLRAGFAPDKLSVALARTIRTIHRIPCGGTDSIDLRALIDGLIDGFKQSRMLGGPVFDECFGYYAAVRSAYPWQDTGKVFSHNDLNPNNILCDGERIWIVDWDTASVNDRYIDLANAANYFVHTPAHEQLYLSTYFDGPPDEHQLSCFFIMRAVCRIIYGMLMFQLAASYKPAGFVHDQEMEGFDMATFSVLRSTGKISLASYEGQLTYGKVLINEALVQMRSPRWEKALAGLS